MSEVALARVGLGSEARAEGPDDARLAAARGGDREAFGQLVRLHEREVYRLCYRHVNDHHDASDLAQEVFLRAFRSMGSFRGESRFSTWLYRIAVNACLNFRSRRRPGEPLPESLPGSGGYEGERLDREARARRVRAAVARLPEKQRATVILKVFQELTHEQVAQLMGSTVGTVKANLFHGLRNLKRLVEEAGVER
jgi:RNA polymerase sigma-70 factor (ECF subfamily)